MGEIARRLRIYGKVQGVWYRDWAVQTATELQLDGWVRNRQDGSVEALVVGDEATIKEFIQRCHGGPPHAQVERVEAFNAKGIVPRGGFIRKPTV